MQERDERQEVSTKTEPHRDKKKKKDRLNRRERLEEIKTER